LFCGAPCFCRLGALKFSRQQKSWRIRDFSKALRCKRGFFANRRFYIMGGLSLPHLLLLGVVVLILFGGKGKISEIMGDVAKGIKSFKKGLSDDEAAVPPPAPADPARTIDHQAQPVLDPSRDTRKVG
jgi:sec-independent protein translocase protein TatA